MNDGANLTVSGVVNGGTAATITDSGIAVGWRHHQRRGGQPERCEYLDLRYRDVTDGGAGTVNLIATGGTINETGTLIAGAHCRAARPARRH